MRRPPVSRCETIIEPGRELFDPERIRPRRRQLDRQRDAVEMPANRRDRRGNAPVRRELRLRRARPRNEQPHGAVSQRVLRVLAALRRDGKRRHPVKPLALCSQRLAARRHHPRCRVGAKQCLGHARRGVDEMLAIVEHQQELLRGERVRDAFGRYNVPARSRPSAVATVAGTRSGSDSGASSMAQTPSANLGSRCRATSKPRRVLPIPPAPVRVTRRWAAVRPRISSNSTSRPISSETGSGRFVGGRDAAGRRRGRPCNRLRMRARRDRADLPGKLVAASGNRADQVAIRPEGAAQGRDLDVQTVLLDDPVRPDALHQRVFADDSPLRLDKRHQHIEGAPAEMDRPTVGEELAAMRQDPETAKLDDRRRFGREIHSRGLEGYLRGFSFFSPIREEGARAGHRICNASHYLREIQRVKSPCRR